jgi:nicotinamide-nucleotide amidase
MNGQIICIGDELISGRTQDTNARYAATKLWPLGISISRIEIIGDDPPDIVEALARGLAVSDFLIICGGLGPTDDDLTAQVAADFLGKPLVESEEMVTKISAAVRKRGREMNPGLMKMCMVPQGSEAICGHCAGFYTPSPGGKPMFFLPGVPSEFRDLIERKVVPRLKELKGGANAVAIRELVIFGLPESIVQGKLNGLAERSGVKLGYYPHFPEVKLVITSEAPDPEQAERLAQNAADEVQGILSDHVVASQGRTLTETVAKAMTQQGLSLALAESCTGGLIGHLLTQVPGSSDFLERGMVVYSNRAKRELLGVKAETLEKYGAVSPETAREMALGAVSRSGTDIGLAVTGIAGPGGGSEQKPVGTVFFGLAQGDQVRAKGYHFHGDRDQVKSQSAEMALNWLRRYLEDHAFIHRT